MKTRNKIFIILLVMVLLITILVTVALHNAGLFVEKGNSIILPHNSISENAIADLAMTFNISETFSNDLLKSSVSLFVVINPIGSIALLIS
ncbi:MAG: hypothetical protein ACRD8Z_12670, partial [Nitrososphaeraceae archaeon]